MASAADANLPVLPDLLRPLGGVPWGADAAPPLPDQPPPPGAHTLPARHRSPAARWPTLLLLTAQPSCPDHPAPPRPHTLLLLLQRTTGMTKRRSWGRRRCRRTRPHGMSTKWRWR